MTYLNMLATRYIVYIPSGSHWGAGKRRVFTTLQQAKEECEFWFAKTGQILSIEEEKHRT